MRAFPILLSCLVILLAGAPSARASTGRESPAEFRSEPIKTLTGKASFYGGRWAGRKTANGETYRPETMTAAHKSLPFGTFVKVTNMRNGVSTIVRINNRGPYIKGRIIDLSVAAARDLRMVNSGVVPVRVDVLALQTAEETTEETVKVAVQPTQKEGQTIFGERKDDWIIGIGSQVTMEKGKPGLAGVRAFYQTYEYCKITLLAFYKMILGDVSPRNIGGPILIAQMAGQQAQEGLGSFLAFLAVLSVNLGVLNLLPVPVLDGGHLLFFFVEAVIRKPVAIKYREMAQQVGICLLALLMVYAFYNDIVRFFEKQVGG